MWTDRIKELRRVKASELAPNAKNWRTHPDNQKAAVAAALEEVGIASALLARELPDGTLELIDGHLRHELDQDQDWPVLVLDVTKAEADIILATFDPLSAMAGADASMLKDLLADMDTQSDDLQKLLDGLAKDHVPPMPTVLEDEVPEPPKKPRSRLGTLWRMGDHRLLCGDSANIGAVARLLGKQRPGLCFTSPPYLDQRTYQGGDCSLEKLLGFMEGVSFCDVVCVNLGMSRKDGEVVRYWDDYIEAAKKFGMKLVSWNIWDRGHAGAIGNATACFPIEHEWIFVFSKSTPKLMPTLPNKTAGQKSAARVRNADGSQGERKVFIKRDFRELGTIYRGPVVNDNSDHPAQFPVHLPSAYIQSIPGDVFDPFAGSGTTLIAAHQLDRRFFGMEISPAYCDVIVARWEALTGKKAVRGKKKLA